MKKVTVKTWGSDPDVVVHIGDDGEIHRGDDILGRVTKGSRTYAPPTHKGSRIVKFRRQVPEWHGWYPGSGRWGHPDVRADSRAEVIRRLLREAA